MSEPIRIKCRSAKDIPSVQELAGMTSQGKHVVLEFRRSWWHKLDKTALVSTLAKSLPDHSVFDSGGDRRAERITVMPVVSRDAVLEESGPIRSALAAYTDACATLIAQRKAGTLSAEWSEDEHGGDVCFENHTTGQVVEAPLSGAPKLREVDPYFFARFVKTTGEYPSVAALLNHDFHDAERMLDIVVKKEEAQQSPAGDRPKAPPEE